MEKVMGEKVGRFEISFWRKEDTKAGKNGYVPEREQRNGMGQRYVLLLPGMRPGAGCVRMAKKYKYQYWHIILESYDDRFPAGSCISNKYKMDYRYYEIFNLSIGKSKIVCEVDYIGRTLTDMPKDEKIKKLIHMK